jgi:hypothetical protein
MRRGKPHWILEYQKLTRSREGCLLRSMVPPSSQFFCNGPFSHILQNYAALSLPDLSDEKVQTISSLRSPAGFVRFVDPSKYWGFDIFKEEVEGAKQDMKTVT